MTEAQKRLLRDAYAATNGGKNTLTRRSNTSRFPAGRGQVKCALVTLEKMVERGYIKSVGLVHEWGFYENGYILTQEGIELVAKETEHGNKEQEAH